MSSESKVETHQEPELQAQTNDILNLASFDEAVESERKKQETAEKESAMKLASIWAVESDSATAPKNEDKKNNEDLLDMFLDKSQTASQSTSKSGSPSKCTSSS
mmetsp:Transcript_17439/g.42630  ORF Transcript_17439/g.42630 Transcript_17439/m.42630 type:complete len:104 (-) Transcript_17439:212-523(-)|eukprot:CAMPEP_0114510224 /NCGR_PEP_ID=MMETSP0109-20121206/13661_1 /TAXON_ID=29199 /ORGANISM="Chlorarachnion reptans, Strain CCCM449" /LENGTH=103 /DNA_ID=CAMNT_0001689493 /DNA_START=22 /DNA_END=333 /DNA_ORIENTATION=+